MNFKNTLVPKQGRIQNQSTISQTNSKSQTASSEQAQILSINLKSLQHQESYVSGQDPHATPPAAQYIDQKQSLNNHEQKGHGPHQECPTKQTGVPQAQANPSPYSPQHMSELFENTQGGSDETGEMKSPPEMNMTDFELAEKLSREIFEEEMNRQPRRRYLPSIRVQREGMNLFYDYQYQRDRIIEGLCIKSGQGDTIEYNYDDYFEEVMSTPLQRAFQVWKPDEVPEKYQDELMERRYKLITEFLYKFSNEKESHPWSSTVMEHKEECKHSQVLWANHTVKKKRDEKLESKRAGLNEQEYDLNGRVQTLREKLKGQTKYDMGFPIAGDQDELNVRCPDCLKHGKVSPLLTSDWAKQKHQESAHSNFVCGVCGQIEKSMSSKQRHIRKAHPKTRHLNRCPQCPDKEFKNLAQRHGHQKQSADLQCMLPCTVEGCKKRFFDSEERSFHMISEHRGENMSTVELDPHRPFEQRKYLDDKKLAEWDAQIKGIRDATGMGMEYEQPENQGDDILGIKVQGELRGWLRLKRVYDQYHSWAVLKDYRLPKEDMYELGQVVEGLLEYIDNQNIAKLYVVVKKGARMFWNKLKFWPVIEQDQCTKVKSVKSALGEDLIMSIRSKNFFANEPIPFEFPSGLPSTFLSNQLRQLQQAILRTSVDSVLCWKFLQRFKTEKLNSKKKQFDKDQAQPSDQARTPMKYIKFAADKFKVSQDVFIDLQKYRPNWNDKQFFNYLKEQIRFGLTWNNIPYSQSSESLAWACLQWIYGMGAVIFLPNESLKTNFAKSVVSAFGTRKFAGIVQFDGFSKDLRMPIDYVFLAQPEQLEWIEYRSKRSQGEGIRKRGEVEKEQESARLWDTEKTDILLRLKSDGAPIRKVRDVLGTGFKFIDTVTDEQVREYQGRLSSEFQI